MREAVKGAERTGLPVWRHKPPFSVEVGGNEGSAHVATKAAAALFIIGPKGAAVKQINAKTGARVVTEQRDGKAAGGLSAGHRFVVCGEDEAVMRAVKIIRQGIEEHTRLLERYVCGYETEAEINVSGVRFYFVHPRKDVAEEYLSSLQEEPEGSYQPYGGPSKRLRVATPSSSLFATPSPAGGDTPSNFPEDPIPGVSYSPKDKYNPWRTQLPGIDSWRDSSLRAA